MRRLILLAALSVLVMPALASPMNQTEPDELRALDDAYETIRDPGAQCLKLALEEYRLVLADADDRADHFYLAQTYEFLASRNLAC